MSDQPMVGIVVVSHSATVASSTLDLVRSPANLADGAGTMSELAGGAA